MIGWRFWVLLAVAIGFVLWAGSELVLLDGKPPSVLDDSESLRTSGGTDSDQIRDESREAMREILRRAETDHGANR